MIYMWDAMTTFVVTSASSSFLLSARQMTDEAHDCHQRNMKVQHFRGDNDFLWKNKIKKVPEFEFHVDLIHTSYSSVRSTTQYINKT